MAYVFGDTFICADKQAAQAVTFNKNIGVKSVTLEGDVYDPSGTLSGGAAPNSSGILVKVQELKAIETQIQQHKAVVDEVSRELANAKKVIDAFRKDKRDLDIREHEVKLLEEQVGGSNATKVGFPVASVSYYNVLKWVDHRRGGSCEKDTGGGQREHQQRQGEAENCTSRLQALGEGDG
jgi:hypothetical protein